MSIKIAVTAIVLAFLSGCASITSNERQSISVSAASADGTLIDKAECTLNNDKGQWSTSTPAFVNIRRSAEDLTVVCKKPGMMDGMLKAVSRATDAMFGNIIIGGGIGAMIDHNKGTGYHYPDHLLVKMGTSVTVDRKEQDAIQQAGIRRLAKSGCDKASGEAC